MFTILPDALSASHLIIASVGSHANELWPSIMIRKPGDIAKLGYTVWVTNSNATRPEIVQHFCKDHDARYVLFVTRAAKSIKQKDDGPPSKAIAKTYSADQKTWRALDPKLSEVSGRIFKSTAGYWLDTLEEVHAATIALECFAKTDGTTLARFEKHESAYPVNRIATKSVGGYWIRAVGRLAPPFAVWLRS